MMSRLFSLVFLIEQIEIIKAENTFELEMNELKKVTGTAAPIDCEPNNSIASINSSDANVNNSSNINISPIKSVFTCVSDFLSSKIFFLIGSGSIMYKFEGIFITAGTVVFMSALGIISNFIPIFKSFYSLFLPIYATLAIFQFTAGYIDILITSILYFIKGNDNGMKLSLVLVSLFILIPFVLGFLFSQEEKLKKSPYHHYFLVIASIVVAIRFNLYENGIYFLSLLSANESSGIFIKTACLIGNGFLKTLKYFFHDALNIICRIVTFFVSLEIMNEIYEFVMNFAKPPVIIPS